MTRGSRNELAVIIVSANSARWLHACLSSLYRSGAGVDLDVVVVAAGCTDATVSVVEREFRQARVLSCENRGFAYANNRGLERVDADWILFLNPDTEILEGSLAALLDGLRGRPSVGLVGVRQLTADGHVHPTIRRFPTAMRWLFESLGSERYPFRASWLGERELDMRRYEQDVACDWTTGAFMLARREALRSAGYMDERFFLYCEEADLCLRIKKAGWEVRHLPSLTIMHDVDKGGWNPRLEAQAAYSQRLYVRKHFSPPHRLASRGALALRYGLRSVGWQFEPQRRKSARAALATILGLKSAPFGAPPSVSFSLDTDNDDEGFSAG